METKITDGAGTARKRFTERLSRALLSSALGLALVAAACSDSAAGSGGSLGPVLAMPADDPGELWTVPAFVGDVELVERSGRTVRLSELDGTPYVAAFVFTRCAGPCPRITADMTWLQRQLRDVEARLVSFTVDPAYDTPEVLARYADDVGADPERWWFLTGPPATIARVSKEGFFQPLESVEAEIQGGAHPTHGTRLVVVDASGRVRGVYDTSDRSERAALRDRVRFVAAEGAQ